MARTKNVKAAAEPIEAEIEAEATVEVVEEVAAPKAAKKAKKPAAEKKTKAKAVPTSDEEAQETGSDDAAAAPVPAAKRHVRTPLERVDQLISLLENEKVNKNVREELKLLRKQLDGAKIRTEKRTRPANAYNLFMQEKMKELRVQYPTEESKKVFAMCIELWRQQKGAAAAEAAEA